ncbi:molybdopterin-binding protein [Dethiothermospora halolimnae]|uniref:molybdopterin-binding protein n=1 Tax=Dethiothermospora halolimnae TaxID=3114390 RepID=UPI003CCB89AB
MKKIKVEDAVGMILAHDLTKIVPGEFKGAAYKKGHVISEEDIDKLKDMGKNHINVLELTEKDIHEDDAAQRIADAIGGEGLYYTDPSEGKVSLKSKAKGILKIDVDRLDSINDIELVIVSTLHNNTLVDKGQVVAGTRIIPLATEKDKIEKIENICKGTGGIIKINSLKSMKVGIVTTGSEVYDGRIKDKFGPVLKDKINHYGGEFADIEYAPDDLEKIEGSIRKLIDRGCEVILTSGGMSVDADDVTPTAIRNVSNEVITYGSPILPGAMFMLAYKNEVAILGIPACGMYHKTTVLDLIFPRVLTGEKLTRKDITKLGHGGLCMKCDVCRYPICPFGK